MLHALSTAALERAQTRDSREGGCGLEFGATSHTATQSLSDLTDSDSEEDRYRAQSTSEAIITGYFGCSKKRAVAHGMTW